jgi:hypothetical protein
MSVFSSLLKKHIFQIGKDFLLNVKETELRAIVDSVIIIFKILNQDVVAMCTMGCCKKKFRNTPLVNNPVQCGTKVSNIGCNFLI